MSKIHIHEKILTFLIENQQSYSIREISKKISADYKQVHTKIKELKQEINFTVQGKSILCKFNHTLTPKVYEVECNRRQKYLKNKDLQIIQKRLDELNIPIIVLLFGSKLKNVNNTSDIDLIIISSQEKKIKQEIELIPKDIHATIITRSEFEKMQDTKSFNVIQEVTKKNIILLGIEEYYRILKNAHRKTNP